MRYEPRVPDESVNVSGVSPLGELARSAGLFFLGLAVLGVLITYSVDLAIRLIPPDFEKRTFANLALVPATGTTALDPQQVEVQKLTSRLAAHWKDAPYSFTTSVNASPEPNAGAFPGGAIMVTSGLLAEVKSENELAFVLGHELGHFRGRHHLRRLGRTALYGLAVSAVLGQTGRGASAGSAIASLTERGFDRSQEEEADAFGLELLNAEYGHVQDAGGFFARIAKPGVGDRLVAYVSTHPAPADRGERLTRLARTKGYSLRGAATGLKVP